jgi:hypothetical protein
MPMIVTANGAKVRCEARKTWAVVLDVPPFSRFLGRHTSDGAAVWEDVPAQAVVVFRTNDRKALVKRVNAERRKISLLSGPRVNTSVGVFHLPTRSWTVPTRERVSVRDHVAAGG